MPRHTARVGRQILWALAAAGLALTGAPARAAEPDPPQIVGGEPAQPCAWPSVVALNGGGLCTGTLVHPRIVVYAAHCGTLHPEALFGETVDAPARAVATRECRRFTNLVAVSSMDYAYCELAEPVTDVPITPLLSGCDEALIAVGTPVTIVGFGNTNPDEEGEAETGIKHVAETTITGMLTTIGVGGMGTGADEGDSGGPALVQVADGSWRVLGIVSGGGGHGATVQYVPAPLTIPWIEDQSSVDVSACTDVNEGGTATWAPTPACGGFFLANDPAATWAEGCAGSLSGPSDACGDPWADDDDDTSPTVTFVEPEDGHVFPFAPATFSVTLDADDDAAGVRAVELAVGDAVFVDEVPPFSFAGVQVETEGPHTLEARAIDHADNTGFATIEVFVGDPVGDTGDESGTETDEADGTDETDTASGGACTCSTPSRPRAPTVLALSALGLSLFLRRRRGRRAAGPKPGPTDRWSPARRRA